MKTSVCLAGATGWMGRALSKAIFDSQDFILSAALSKNHAGENLGKIIDQPLLNLVISKSIEDALAANVDVLVDYTLPGAVKGHTLAAIGNGIPVVIGTSGLSDDDYEEIRKAAEEKQVGVIAGGNFSITAALLERFACEAANFLTHWEIIDYASDKKPDAPSGVSRELSYLLSRIRRPEIAIPVKETAGITESRGASLNEMQIHSVRLPGYLIALEIIFGAQDERLTIRHDAGSGASPYIEGTLLAVRKVRNYKRLIRGLGNVLFDDPKAS